MAACQPLVRGAAAPPGTVREMAALPSPDVLDGVVLEPHRSALSARRSLRIGLISDTHIPEARAELWPQVFAVFEGVDAHPPRRRHPRARRARPARRGRPAVVGPRQRRGRLRRAADRPRRRPAALLVAARPRRRARRPHPRRADAGAAAELHRRAVEGRAASARTDIDVLVYGDSHVERIDVVGSTLCVNPGSPTYPHNLNTQLGTLGFLEIDPARMRASIWQLTDDGVGGPDRRAGPCRERPRMSRTVTYENLLVETDGPVATITLNRPEQLNAMSTGLLDDLFQALRDLNPGDDVRVIRLRGAGRAFCPGYDLSPASSVLVAAADDSGATARRWPTSASRRSPVTASRCAR